MAQADYKVEKLGDLTIVAVAINIVYHEANEELVKFFEKLVGEGSKKIVLDLAGTIYVSSLILASLVYVHKRVSDAGGALILCNIKEKVQEVLTMTNLDKVFEITKTRQDAIAKFKG